MQRETGEPEGDAAPNVVHKYIDPDHVRKFLATDATKYLSQYLITPLQNVRVVRIDSPVVVETQLHLVSLEPSPEIRRIYIRCVGNINTSIKAMQAYNEPVGGAGEANAADESFTVIDKPYWNNAGNFRVMLITMHPTELSKVQGYQVVFTTIEDEQRVIIFTHHDGTVYMVLLDDTREESLRMLLDGPITLKCQICVMERICARPDCFKFFGSGNKTRCGKCKAIRYCCLECQRMDWARHKDMCVNAEFAMICRRIKNCFNPTAD